MKTGLEAQLTIPTGGWSFTVNATPKTIAAGSYYPSTLAIAFDVALTSPPVDANVSVDTSTGQVTITGLSGVFSITWTSTSLRDALGFSGDLSGSANYTGGRGMQGLWLSGCHVAGATFDPATNGHAHSDETQLVGPTGQLATFVSNQYRSHRNVVWQHVERARALDGGDATLVSFQEWVRTAQRGGLAHFVCTAAGARPPVLFYEVGGDPIGDSGGDGVYRLRLPPDLELSRPVEGYTGYYTVQIPEMIKV